MTVKTITKSEYYILVGLKTLAKSLDDKLNSINDAVHEIFQETDSNGNRLHLPGDGWAGELIFGNRDLDDVLRILKIEVTE